jgi:hypothetical protein
VDTQVERVWGKPMDNTTRKMLNRIASLNADALLRTGQA